MATIWQNAATRLAAGQHLVLAIVVAHRGSAPGKQGFKMIIGAEGPLAGTIGGGRMEFDLVKLAGDMLRNAAHAPLLLKKVHRARAPAAERSGMICAGSQQLLLQPLGPAHLPTIERIARAADGELPGFLEATPSGIDLVAQPGGTGLGFHNEPTGWCYRERLGARDTLYIAGSGHVGLAVSRIMALLDFHVVVFDHRADIPTVAENRFAHELMIIPYREIGAHIEEGDHAYAVIVTTAYPSDVEALLQLADKRLKYLGLMGSAAKIKKIFAEVTAAGVGSAALARIKAPIGLPINNHTPAEIAVSIAAQIIHIRNGGTCPPDRR